MSATRTRTRDRTMSSGDIGRRCSACRDVPPIPRDADEVISRVTRGEPMTADELLRAFAFLSRFVTSGRQNVLVARVRVAVRLETLGA